MQDRLVKELALAGITTIEAADTFIRVVFILDYNAHFSVKAEQKGSAFAANTLRIATFSARSRLARPESFIGSARWAIWA